MIMEILTFCQLFFRVMAKSTIDLAIRSDGLSLFKSFVPTGKIVWSGFLSLMASCDFHASSFRPRKTFYVYFTIFKFLTHVVHVDMFNHTITKYNNILFL